MTVKSTKDNVKSTRNCKTRIRLWRKSTFRKETEEKEKPMKEAKKDPVENEIWKRGVLKARRENFKEGRLKSSGKLRSIMYRIG